MTSVFLDFVRAVVDGDIAEVSRHLAANAALATVRALLDAGADATQRNKAGSTPLHLAVQTTGRGGSGSPRAREQQGAIVRLLIERGARIADTDAKGRTVRQAATSEPIRTL